MNKNVQNIKNQKIMEKSKLSDDKNNELIKIKKSILKIDLIYLTFFVLLFVSLILTLVNYLQDFQNTVFIDVPIIVDIISIIFLEFLGVILVIRQSKLKETSQENKKIWILYFLGLFLIIPSITAISIESNKKQLKNKQISNENKYINGYANSSFLYIAISFYFFAELFFVLLARYNLLAYYLEHGMYSSFWLRISFFLIPLIGLELINIKLISQSIKLEKMYPSKIIKCLWLYHLLGLFCIIPSLVIVFAVLNKCKKIIDEQENENTNNLNSKTKIKKDHIKLDNKNLKVLLFTEEQKKLVYYYMRYFKAYIASWIFFLIIIVAFIAIEIYFNYIILLILVLIIFIFIGIIIIVSNFWLTVQQAKIEENFPNSTKKIFILYFIGMFLIVPTIVGVFITRKDCKKIINEIENENKFTIKK